MWTFPTTKIIMSVRIFKIYIRKCDNNRLENSNFPKKSLEGEYITFIGEKRCLINECNFFFRYEYFFSPYIKRIYDEVLLFI